MPSFALAGHTVKTVTVSRNQVFYQCWFRLPDDFKEQRPFIDTRQIEADLTMGFYCDPMPNDELIYQGLLWRVTSRRHWPTRRNSRDKKVVAALILEYLGEVEQ
jgi:hypothetical protein